MRRDATPASTGAAEPERVDIEVAGCRTATFRYGDPDGPVVLALHGFRGTHAGLAPLSRELAARGFRVIAPDAPGCGASDRLRGVHDVESIAGWFRELARACGNPRTLLGHSFGSVIVAATAARRGEEGTAVLINPVASLPLDGVSRHGASLARLFYAAASRLPDRAGRALLAHPLGAVVSAAVMTTTRDRALRRWIRDEHRRQAGAFADRDSVLQLYRAAIAATVIDHAPALTCPTLIIGAERDQLSPVAAQRALGDSLADATVRILPGRGHLIPYEAPGLAAETIDAWLTAQQRRAEPDPA
jgi:pimeloyl-ACP methyl ester carboxylesterase